MLQMVMSIHTSASFSLAQRLDVSPLSIELMHRVESPPNPHCGGSMDEFDSFSFPSQNSHALSASNRRQIHIFGVALLLKLEASDSLHCADDNI